MATTSRLRSAILLAAASLLPAGCGLGSSEGHFIGGRDEILCSDVFQQCDGARAAGCVLDENHYISGTFPGTRTFLVETSPGDWLIKVMIFIDDRLSPGTETLIKWYEPGCKDIYTYTLSEDSKDVGDFFEQAGKSQVFAKEHVVYRDGDHLIEVYSDSTCRYDIRIELNRKQ